MFTRPMHALCTTSTLALIVAACGESAVIDPGPAASELPTVEARAPSAPVTHALSGANAQLAALHGLQAAFHRALNRSDEDAVRALWAPDAVV